MLLAIALVVKCNKQIRRIVVHRPATNLTLKKVKGQGQGHDMVSIERACYKGHGRTDGQMRFNVPRFRERRGTTTTIV